MISAGLLGTATLKHNLTKTRCILLVGAESCFENDWQFFFCKTSASGMIYHINESSFVS